MSLNERFLVPRPQGVVQAMRASADDPRRRLLLALLCGGWNGPIKIPEIARWAGLTDLHVVGTMLFRMQRDEWLDGDAKPLKVPEGAVSTVVPELLHHLSSSGRGVLCTEEGLVYARVGMPRRTAEEIAVLSAGLRPLVRRVSQSVIDEGKDDGACAWGLMSAVDRVQLFVMPLQFGKRLFYLALGATPHLEVIQLVQLVAVLGIRYERERIK